MASSSRASATTRPTRSPESFDSLSRRNDAAEILQSYEKLSWHSFHRCESLTQTRLHFQNIIAGFGSQDELAHVRWPEDRTPFASKAGNDSRRSSKGKGREIAKEGNWEGAADAASSARDGASRGGVRESMGGGGSSTKKRRSNGSRPTS